MIADDHVLVRKGIRALLASQADFQLVAEAGSYAEAVEQLHAHRADVVMLDISMPGRDGLDLITYVRSVQPQARIIVLTMHTEDEFASRALKAGTHGYITKDSSPDQLTAAIRRVASGSSFLSPRIAESLALRLTRQDDAPAHERLSRREFAILSLIHI